jgi:hypothetical protein
MPRATRRRRTDARYASGGVSWRRSRAHIVPPHRFGARARRQLTPRSRSERPYGSLQGARAQSSRSPNLAVPNLAEPKPREALGSVFLRYFGAAPRAARRRNDIVMQRCGPTFP